MFLLITWDISPESPAATKSSELQKVSRIFSAPGQLLSSSRPLDRQPFAADSIRTRSLLIVHWGLIARWEFNGYPTPLRGSCSLSIYIHELAAVCSSPLPSECARLIKGLDLRTKGLLSFIMRPGDSS